MRTTPARRARRPVLRRRATDAAPPPPVAEKDDGTPAGRRWLRRPSTLVMLVATVAVVAVAATGIVLARRGASGPAASAQQSPGPSGPTLLQVISRLDPSVAAAVGTGGIADPFTRLRDAAPLVDSGGRPVVFFVATAGCSDCAAQRWSLLVALARFGTLSHVPLMALPQTASTPAIPTFSLVGVQYSSEYVTLAGFEKADLAGNTLDTLSASGQRLLDTYDVPPYVRTAHLVPWLDVANAAVMQGSDFAPDLLGGLSWDQVAAKLSTPSDPVAKAVVGQANHITAAICRATSMQPASVCGAAPIPSMVAAAG